ncbi:uncharacterized protein V6R79_006963 [Siganus canaliculatus]
MMWKIVFAVLVGVFAVGLGGLVGGPQDASLDDEGVQNALSFAVRHHNRQSNDMYLHQVAEVVKVQKQVVAGIKYLITVRMVKTSCRKEGATEECAMPQDQIKSVPYTCEFHVWSRPWMSDIRVTHEQC